MFIKRLNFYCNTLKRKGLMFDKIHQLSEDRQFIKHFNKKYYESIGCWRERDART